MSCRADVAGPIPAVQAALIDPKKRDAVNSSAMLSRPVSAIRRNGLAQAQ